ncbi:MAG: PhnD/SsuA/transferrin family substrate-binding protein [Shewanella sp.]|nr:PhnD/SsuA/transferrin family substrate-binding protein [Shewanella sp.]MCF1429935.1 PhnD/SsuA/transferrin family substrate-binding protein [Shewanella sp.]MCF1438528.1 PhnD/SsuA/transferrin family substrate-binding protein [Shewanella sp.]MCF1456750.1 PhnD/SsuA/transferrin family substrate-binding protein [Shewanella sp.]
MHLRASVLLLAYILFSLIGLMTAPVVSATESTTKPISGQPASKVKVYRIGVLANWGYQKAKERWQPMMDYLSTHVPEARFKVQPSTFEELNQALLDNRIQFIITNPGQYLYLSNQYPLSWLATMRSLRHNGTTKAIGSAILVRADSNYRTLHDLKDKVIAASAPHALGGYQATVGLMHKLGMDPESWFKRVKFLGFPLDPLVYQVRDGNVDAAITPLCTLEDMAKRGLIDEQDFRVLNPSRPDGYDCQCSTNLYPNWSFAASEYVNVRLAKEVTQALLAMPADDPAAVKAELSGWTSPISLLQVSQLFAELNVAKNQPPKWESVIDWLRANQSWGILAALVFLIATIYHLWIEYKVRQKSDTLVETERQLKLKAVAMERLQSTAILGEIGAGLAHELNQPIAAITSYSEGGIMRLQAKGEGYEESLALLEKINRQSVRAGEVVHRIRGLLKRREAVMEDVNLLTLVEESIALLKLELDRRRVRVSTKVNGEPFIVTADRVGMQQVLVNLLKNSLDALSDMPAGHAGHIEVQFDFLAQQLNLTLTDNGPGLSLPSNELITTFFSTKADGLGLGLAICSDVLKQHEASFNLSNRCDGQTGCTATLKLKRRGSTKAVI